MKNAFSILFKNMCFLYFVYMNVLPACMDVYHICDANAKARRGNQIYSTRVTGFCDLGAGNWAQAPCQSNKCSYQGPPQWYLVNEVQDLDEEN